MKVSDFLYLRPVTGDDDIKNFSERSVFWVKGHNTYEDGLYIITTDNQLRAIQTKKVKKKK